MAAIDMEDDGFPVFRVLENDAPVGWEYREVPDWEDGLLEYRREEEASRGQPSVKVFDTDFDEYRVRLDAREYGVEVQNTYVDSVEAAVEEMNELAAEYNVRQFLDDF